MTAYDQKVIFTSFAFLAVLLKKNTEKVGLLAFLTSLLKKPNVVQKKKHVEQIRQLAELFSLFCAEIIPPSVPASENSHDEGDAAHVDQDITRYKTELNAEGSVELPLDRKTRIALYNRLLLRKVQYKQPDFYKTASDDEIANRILRLLLSEIDQDWKEQES